MHGYVRVAGRFVRFNYH